MLGFLCVYLVFVAIDRKVIWVKTHENTAKEGSNGVFASNGVKNWPKRGTNRIKGAKS